MKPFASPGIAHPRQHAIRGPGGHGPMRGLSLVEFMVAQALGLVLIGAALIVWADQTHQHREWLQQARLGHDLRSSARLIAQQLRRAGYASPAGLSQSPPDPHLDSHLELGPHQVLFQVARQQPSSAQVARPTKIGVRLKNGVLEWAIGSGSWQALTDPDVLRITALNIEPGRTEALPEPACPATCPPSCKAQRLHSLRIALVAETSSGPIRTASYRTEIALRNAPIIRQCQSV